MADESNLDQIMSRITKETRLSSKTIVWIIATTKYSLNNLGPFLSCN